jgi:hypothetical protein
LLAYLVYTASSLNTQVKNQNSNEKDLDQLIELLQARHNAQANSSRPRTSIKTLKQRTQLAPDAPAPRINDVIAVHGLEPTTRALEAWAARINGAPIIDVAHQMGISIEHAKKLIREVHDAIHDDLKENLALNRQLDLDRLDGILSSYYPSAKAGDAESAQVVLRALKHRAQLTGLEAPPVPGHSHPENVMIWIQNQLPQINRLVDSLPLELPPSPPAL